MLGSLSTISVLASSQADGSRHIHILPGDTMPYTPPTQHSPVSSRPETPNLSRSHSYHPDQPASNVRVNGSSRPALPPSASSASYLHKHRRSPSVTKPTTLSSSHNTWLNTTRLDSAGLSTDVTRPEERIKPFTGRSLHQSPPPPVYESPIPTGVVMSPPDSTHNSSDEEENGRPGRKRELADLAELQAAIRTIEQHRKSSLSPGNDEKAPGRQPLELVVPSSQPMRSESTAVGQPLSSAARKISHSRSATESSAQLGTGSDSPHRCVSDSEVDDYDDRPWKPAMVRKKSGELVRPALRPPSARRRPSSMPGTPTYSKAVHFDAELEHVRHFLQVDRPLAVSAGSSPVDYENEKEFPFGNRESSFLSPPFEWEIRLANFAPVTSLERRSMPVRVEKAYLSADNKQLIGAIAVANLAFHKLVVARFTLDYWKTTSEVVAEYSNDVRHRIDDGYDRFHFSIKLEDQAHLENKVLFFCVRYNVNGQEFWDSNGNINYQVDFTKKPVPQKGKKGMPGNASRPLGSLPRSSSPSSRPRPKSTSFDDFAHGFEAPYDFRLATTFRESPIRLKTPKPAEKMVLDAPARRAKAPAQAFGNRYDFGASISAAIQAANTVSVDRNSPASDEFRFSPTKPMSAAEKPGAAASTMVVPNGTGVPAAPADTHKPSALTAEKPPLQSQSYSELLDKYCFVRSRGPKDGPEVNG